ncbi:hypothetical protein ACFS7Z_08470 [Pontibacter toksunensis]|uniref:Uncharacterized protein n=1 Tax=Pontibacter toksunensis TaxID=1332631 RepID=A0ABW6BRF6_9BACT
MRRIFEVEPPQWGLRGDPYLWNALREYMSSEKQPKNEEEFVILFRKAFEILAGEDLAPGKEIFIESFDKGGMSSGYVCADWWLSDGLPLLRKRFSEVFL